MIMSQFKLLNSVYFGDKLYDAGTVVELDEKDEKVQGYLERGSIAPYDPNEKPSEEETVPTSVEDEDTPVPPQVTSSDPSPEQIEQDLKAAGA